MNNFDRVAEEIRRHAHQISTAHAPPKGPGRPTTDELVHFLLEVVNLEDLHARKPRNVNREVETMLRTMARPQSGQVRADQGRQEC